MSLRCLWSPGSELSMKALPMYLEKQCPRDDRDNNTALVPNS